MVSFTRGERKVKNPASAFPPRFFESADGKRLAFRETGEGRPVVLIHGFFSNAWTNWLRWGHAQAVAARGFRVIMPDLRGHGDSAAPGDPAAYPPDVLAEDGEALIAHLGLEDFDLGGYSLGARTAVRMHARGVRPGRLVVAGMGLSGLTDLAGRTDHWRHVLTNLGKHPRGSNELMAEAFLKTTGGDAQAMLCVLETFTNTSEADIRAIAVPTLILAGEEDDDNGSHEDLAALIPGAVRKEVPGGHMSAIVKPEFGEAIAEFLAEGRG